MATFPFRDSDIPLVMGVDDLELGDAETLEVDLGIDLRDVLKQPMTKMLRAFVLMSVRRVFPDVAADAPELRRVKLGPLLAAVTAHMAEAESLLREEGVGADDAAQIAEAAPGVVLSPTSAGSSE